MEILSMTKDMVSELCSMTIPEFIKVAINLILGNWECDYKHGLGYEKFNNLCVY
jgi:hypothetical protein